MTGRGKALNTPAEHTDYKITWSTRGNDQMGEMTCSTPLEAYKILLSTVTRGQGKITSWAFYFRDTRDPEEDGWHILDGWMEMS